MQSFPDGTLRSDAGQLVFVAAFYLLPAGITDPSYNGVVN